MCGRGGISLDDGGEALRRRVIDAMVGNTLKCGCSLRVGAEVVRVWACTEVMTKGRTPMQVPKMVSFTLRD